MKALDIIFYVSITASVASAPLFFFFGIPYLTSRNDQKTRARIVSLIVFISSVLVGLAVAETSADIGHREILRKIESLNKDCRISINRNAADNPDEIISVLKTLEWKPSHHSNSTKENQYRDFEPYTQTRAFTCERFWRPTRVLGLLSQVVLFIG